MDEIAEKVVAPLERITQQVGVDRAFGAPLTQGDVTVIPVADVFVGVGFGFGSGTGGQDAELAEAAAESAAGGAGGGGGGGGKARPIGVFRIGPDGVDFEPTVDPTRLAIGGMALAAWVVFWVGVTLRSVGRSLAGR